MDKKEIERRVEQLADALRSASEITGYLPDRSGENG